MMFSSHSTAHWGFSAPPWQELRHSFAVCPYFCTCDNFLGMHQSPSASVHWWLFLRAQSTQSVGQNSFSCRIRWHSAKSVSSCGPGFHKSWSFFKSCNVSKRSPSNAVREISANFPTTLALLVGPHLTIVRQVSNPSPFLLVKTIFSAFPLQWLVFTSDFHRSDDFLHSSTLKPSSPQTLQIQIVHYQLLLPDTSALPGPIPPTKDESHLSHSLSFIRSSRNCFACSAAWSLCLIHSLVPSLAGSSLQLAVTHFWAHHVNANEPRKPHSFLSSRFVCAAKLLLSRWDPDSYRSMFNNRVQTTHAAPCPHNHAHSKLVKWSYFSDTLLISKKDGQWRCATPRTCADDQERQPTAPSWHGGSQPCSAVWQTRSLMSWTHSCVTFDPDKLNNSAPRKNDVSLSGTVRDRSLILAHPTHWDQCFASKIHKTPPDIDVESSKSHSSMFRRVSDMTIL